MKAEIRIWSEIGHTPLTNRVGSYCDELVCVVVDAATHAEAKAAGVALLKSTPHAVKGHVSMPELPNQNFRSTWMTKSLLGS